MSSFGSCCRYPVRLEKCTYLKTKLQTRAYECHSVLEKFLVKCKFDMAGKLKWLFYWHWIWDNDNLFNWSHDSWPPSRISAKSQATFFPTFSRCQIFLFMFLWNKIESMECQICRHAAACIHEWKWEETKYFTVRVFCV